MHVYLMKKLKLLIHLYVLILISQDTSRKIQNISKIKNSSPKFFFIND